MHLAARTVPCDCQHRGLFTRRLRAKNLSCTAERPGMDGRTWARSDQESGGKQFTETWLVLEYCDRGNLQDAVDRGRVHQAASRSNARWQRAYVQCEIGQVSRHHTSSLQAVGSTHNTFQSVDCAMMTPAFAKGFWQADMSEVLTGTPPLGHAR